MSPKNVPLLLVSLFGCAHFATPTQAVFVFSWGGNWNGQLDQGDSLNRTTPASVSNLSTATSISAGGDHGLATKSDGQAYAWGGNSYGQLGDGTTTTRSTAVPALGLTSVTQVSAGDFFSLALLSDGTVRSWGANSSGRLGDGTTTTRTTPVTVSGLSSVVEVAAGGSHGLALLSNGTVSAWGWNSSGQLGDGTTTTHLTPGTVPLLSSVALVAAGNNHSLAILNDGTVRAWGANASGQLGIGSTINRSTPTVVSGINGIFRVAAGGSHSLALRYDGTVRAWGQNASGQLGDGTTTQRTTAITVPGLSSITAIAAGSSSSYALQDDGSLWVWGSNTDSQLGLGDITSRTSPTHLLPPSGYYYTGIEAGGMSAFATAVANRVVTATNTVNLGKFLKGSGMVAATGTANLTTTGSNSDYTSITVPMTSSPDGNGISITGGSGTLFDSASATGSRTLAGTINTAAYGTVSGSIVLAPTGVGIVNQSPIGVTVNYFAMIGAATPAATTNANLHSFSSAEALTASVGPGNSYAGLSSKITRDAVLDNITGFLTSGSRLGTEAVFRDGTNSTGGTESVSMNWRTRAPCETGNSLTNTATSPPVAGAFGSNPGRFGLFSDIVEITGMNGAAGGTTHTQTDKFVLQMSYNPADLQATMNATGKTEAQLAAAGFLYLGWLDTQGTETTADDVWRNAVEGNFTGIAYNGSGLLDSYDHYKSDDFHVGHVPGKGAGNFTVGDWGVDVAAHTVWAVLDHNSQFAVLPEPSMFILGAFGAAGLIAVVRRRRVVQHDSSVCCGTSCR